MEVFARQDAVLCGIDEAKNLLGHVLAESDLTETRLDALDDGDVISPKEVVLRIRARYRRIGLYETAMLGMLAQSTGWATADGCGFMISGHSKSSMPMIDRSRGLERLRSTSPRITPIVMRLLSASIAEGRSRPDIIRRVLSKACS